MWCHMYRYFIYLSFYWQGNVFVKAWMTGTEYFKISLFCLWCDVAFLGTNNFVEFCGILFKLGSLNNSRPAMWNIDKKGNYHHVKFNSLSYIYVMCFVSEVSFYLFYFQNCLNKFAHEMGEMLKYFNVSQSPSLFSTGM